MDYPIGILDSGVGGLSILQEVRKLLPHEDIMYVADTINCPYGALSAEEIYTNASKMVEFLLGREVKLIIVACNTITVTCIDTLRETFSDVPIIGTVPVIKTAAEVTKNGIIGVLSTCATSESDYQKALISRFAQNHTVVNYGTNKIVPFIERGEVDSEAFHSMLSHELDLFRQMDVDTIALGCTHFPFIEKQIQEIMGDGVRLLDSGGAIARHVARILKANSSQAFEGNGIIQYFITGDKKSFYDSTAATLGSGIEPTRISLEAY